MFCKQNAYTPKSLDAKSVLQRIHTKSGSTSRKIISKQDFLQPFFNCEFSDVHSSRIAQNIERYIKGTRKYQRETQYFVETVLNRIYFLHKYNLKVAEVTFKYPLTPNLTHLLLRYIVLECSVLYNRGYHKLRYERVVEERILKLLHIIYHSYLESLNTIPPEKLYKEQCIAILNLLIKVKSEFEVQNDLMENIAKRLLTKMGKLEQVNALKKKCIPCPLDTYLNDPAVVNSYENIITSDYGTDTDLKIEEEIIQDDTRNEDSNDANQDVDIKQDINELLRVSNKYRQNSITNSTAKNVPTIYIDDDNEEMLVLEEEVRSSTKWARRQKTEEEKRIVLREKQYGMLSNHKPFTDDVKPYMKVEVVDLNSDDECSTSENRSHNTVNKSIRKPVVVDEVVIIDDDDTEEPVQLSPKSGSSEVILQKSNEEEILELSSDEDEPFSVIPKEEEEELLREDTSVEINESLKSTVSSTIPSGAAINIVDESVHKILSNTSNTNSTITDNFYVSMPSDMLVSNLPVTDNLENPISPQPENIYEDIKSVTSKDAAEKQTSKRQTAEAKKTLTENINLKNLEKTGDLTDRRNGEESGDVMQTLEEIEKRNVEVTDSKKSDLLENTINVECTSPEDILSKDITKNKTSDEVYIDKSHEANAKENIHANVESTEVQIDENLGKQIEDKDKKRDVLKTNLTDDLIEDLVAEESNTKLFKENKLVNDNAKIFQHTEKVEKLTKIDVSTEKPTESCLESKSVIEVEKSVTKEKCPIDTEKEELVDEICSLTDLQDTKTHLENREQEQMEGSNIDVEDSKPLEQKEECEENVETYLENNEQLKIGVVDAEVEGSELSEQKKEDEDVEKCPENNEHSKIGEIDEDLDLSTSLGKKEEGERNIETHLEDNQQDRFEATQKKNDMNIAIQKTTILAEECNAGDSITVGVSETENLLENKENISDSNTLKLIENPEAPFENLANKTIFGASNINDIEAVDSEVSTVVANERIEAIKIHESDNLIANELHENRVPNLPPEQTNVILNSHTNDNVEAEPEYLWVSKDLNKINEVVVEENDFENFNTSQVEHNEDDVSQCTEDTKMLDAVIEESVEITPVCHTCDELNEDDLSQNENRERSGFEITNEANITSRNMNMDEANIQKVITKDEISIGEGNINIIESEGTHETPSLSCDEIKEKILDVESSIDSNEETNIKVDIENVNASCKKVSLEVADDLPANESSVSSSDKVEKGVDQEETRKQNDEDEELNKNDEPEIVVNKKVKDNSQEKFFGKQDMSPDPLNETQDSILKDERGSETIEEQKIDEEKIDSMSMVHQAQTAPAEILLPKETELRILSENNHCENSNSEEQSTKHIEIQDSLVKSLPTNQEFINKSSGVDTEKNVASNIRSPEVENFNTDYVKENAEDIVVSENDLTIELGGDENQTEERETIKEQNDDADNNINLTESHEVTEQETVDLNEVEKLSKEPTETFLEENITNDKETAETCTEDIEKNTLIEDTFLPSDLQTSEENIDTQEIFQFHNTDHEIEISTEEQKEIIKNDDVVTVTEAIEENEVDKKLEESDIHFSNDKENIYEVIDTNHFQIVGSTDPSVAEEICYEKYIPDGNEEANLISNLHIQEEIITEVDTLELGISEEFIVSENTVQSYEQATDTSSDNKHSLSDQMVPVTIQMGLPLMEIEKIKVGNIITNDQLIPKHLEICDIPDIPDENTSLNLLAAVASEVSRQDLLVVKKKKRTVHPERRKKQNNLKNKIKGVQESHSTKKKTKGTLVVSNNIENKRVTRSAQVKMRTEVYHEPKCRPHDFVVTNNSGAPPKSNIIYTQKLADVHLTSEDSNDSEGILLIDEDIDMSSSKLSKEASSALQNKKFTYYDESTMEENFTFCYEPKVKGTVLISIPDTYQGNFEFLTQIEQLDTTKEDNMQNLQNDIVSSVIDINTKTFDEVISSKNEENLTETESLVEKSNISNTQKSECPILEKSHKPFRTKAEQKDYDKFSLKPYVSIERLNITSDSEERCERSRSKSVDVNIIRNLCDEHNTSHDSDALNNKSAKVPSIESDDQPSQGQISGLDSEQKVNSIPTETELKSNVDNEICNMGANQDSDDDVPLLQRTQSESKQIKKSFTSSKSTSDPKKEKTSRKIDFNKSVKGKGDKSKKKPRKSLVGVKEDKDGLNEKLSKEIMGAEKVVSTDECKNTKIGHGTRKIGGKSKTVEQRAKNSDNEIEALKRRTNVEKNISTEIKKPTKSKEKSKIPTNLIKSSEQCMSASTQSSLSKEIGGSTPCEENTKGKISVEKETNVDTSNHIPSSVSDLMKESRDTIVSSWKSSLPSTSRVEDNIVPTNLEVGSENVVTEKDNLYMSQNNVQLINEGSTYEEFMKTSNTKYYTTPKLRRKSVSKHNLNRNEKNSDVKHLMYKGDKKYYTPPKLRRKSVVESEVTSDGATITKPVTPKQIKLSTSNVEILSKCKNTISPTTEKLKRKLETDLKFNSTESTSENASDDSQITSHDQNDDHVSNSEGVNSDPTENISRKSENTSLLVGDNQVPNTTPVNNNTSITDLTEQNMCEGATDKLKTTKLESEQDENIVITDDKLEQPCVVANIIDVTSTPTLQEEPDPSQIGDTNSNIDMPKPQSDPSIEIPNDTHQAVTNKSEDTVMKGVVEDDENLDNLPLSERSSVSCQNQLATAEIKNQMKPHKKRTKKIVPNDKSNIAVENKEKHHNDNQPENVIPNFEKPSKNVEETAIAVDNDNAKLPQKNKKSKTNPVEEVRNIHEKSKALKQHNIIQKDRHKKLNEWTKSKEKTKKGRDNKQKKYDKLFRNRESRTDEYKNVKSDTKKRNTKTKSVERLSKNDDVETEAAKPIVSSEKNSSVQLEESTEPKEMAKTSTDLFENKEQCMSYSNQNSASKDSTNSTAQVEVNSNKEKKKSKINEKPKQTSDTESGHKVKLAQLFSAPEESIPKIKDIKNKPSKKDICPSQQETENLKIDSESQLSNKEQLRDKSDVIPKPVSRLSSVTLPKNEEDTKDHSSKKKKSDAIPEFISRLSSVTLPKNEEDTKDHSFKKKKVSDSRSKKSASLKPDAEKFSKSKHVSDVSNIAASDVSKTCDISTRSVKITDDLSNCTSRSKSYGETNKKTKDKNDKKRANKKTEESENVEKKKQEEGTNCLKTVKKTVKSETSEGKSIDAALANKDNTDITATKNLNDDFIQTPTVLTSNEIVDSSNCEENVIDETQQDVKKHLQIVEEVKPATNSQDILDKIPLDIETASTIDEKVSLTQQELNIKSPIHEPVELPPEVIDSFNINEKVSLTPQEADSSSQLNILDAKSSSESNEGISLNQEPNENSQKSESKDTSDSKNNEHDMENSVTQQLGNCTVTIPLEKVSEIEINWINKTQNKKDHHDSPAKIKMDSKNENNSVLEAMGSVMDHIHTDTTEQKLEEKTKSLNIVEDEIKLEEKSPITNSKEDKSTSDLNLKLESKQNSEQQTEKVNDEVFSSAPEKSIDAGEILIETVAPQNNMLEVASISEQNAEVFINSSVLLTETVVETKESKPTKIEKTNLKEHKDHQKSQEVIEHNSQENIEQSKTKVNSEEVENITLKEESVPAKSENNVISATIAKSDPETKRKRKSNTIIKENVYAEKKTKLSEINIDVSFNETQDVNKSPKLLSPLSISKRKDKKSIECIISQLKEEKVNSMETNDELLKSQPAPSPVTVDVGTLRKKLLQKIKGHSSLKNSHNVDEETAVGIIESKTNPSKPSVLNTEIILTNTIPVEVSNGPETTKLDDESDIKENVHPTTIIPFVATSERKCDIVEEESRNVSITEKIRQEVQKSEIHEVNNADGCEHLLANLEETESMQLQNDVSNPVVDDNISNETVPACTYDTTTDFINPCDINVTNDKESSTPELNEEVINETPDDFGSLSTGDKVFANLENENNDRCKNQSTDITDIKSESAVIFPCETRITTDINSISCDTNESVLNIDNATHEITSSIKENLEMAIPTTVIECETISTIPEIITESSLAVTEEIKLNEDAIMVPIPSHDTSLSTSLTEDLSKNTEEETDDSFNQMKESFPSTCLENSPKKAITESVGTCDFDGTNVETNLLNLCDLMLNVDTVGNVTRDIDESVSSDPVCILSDIIPPPITSTDSKLPCVSSTGTAKLFTFPVTSQAEIKERFVPMNEVNTSKSIFDGSSTSTEKLSPTKNEECLFSLNEQMENAANPQTLTFPDISLNLQDVHFSKIPIDSSQTFDLISPMQTSSSGNFMNEIPVDNEINDISEARGSNTIDHNYTLEPLGGPLLSGRPEEEQIFPTTFDKNLVDSPGEFPLNDNQLPSELSESDDTYKLNLDNEYAVKNLVMLGSQTSDTGTFPLSNYNLSDIKSMNLIEDSISNSEENSNSLDTPSLAASMGQESKDISNNTNPWAQFINEENPNQNIVSPNEQCIASQFCISQNDLIQSASNFDVKLKLGNISVDEELKDIPSNLNPWARFIANENVNQKVVVLPNEQYFTPSLSLSQNDFIQTTALPTSTVDGEDILLKESPELDIKNEPIKSNTSLITSTTQKSKCVPNDAKKLTDINKKVEPAKSDTNKCNIKRNKGSKKVTQKDSIDTNDFLPKRTYSRTVLRAPFKKNTTNSPENTKSTPPNKLTQPSEACLDTKPSTTPPIDQKSLPDVTSLLNTIRIRKDLKQNLKDIPVVVPPKRLKLDLPQSECQSKSPAQNPSETPNPSRSLTEKVSATVKEPKKPEMEVKNSPVETPSENSSNTTRTKETVSSSTKAPEDTPNKKLEVYCSSADLVKLRKRAATNRYSSSYVASSPAKEPKSDSVKSKKTIQRPSSGRLRSNTPEVKTNVESSQQDRKNQQRDQRSLTDNLLEKSIKPSTPKPQPSHENKVPHTETKSTGREGHSGDTSNVDSRCNLRSSTATPEPCQSSSSKYNYSIDSILSKEAKCSSTRSSESLVKDYRQSKYHGLKRTLPTSTDDEIQRKQMKINPSESRRTSTIVTNENPKNFTEGGRQSENNIDKTFDSLLQKGNINKLIHLRVTEDNKLKMERKYNLSLERNSNELEFKMRRERSSSRSREQIEVIKKEADRRSGVLTKSHGRDRDDELAKSRTDRNSPLVKLDSKNKDQSEHSKYARSSFHSSYGRLRDTGSARCREDARSDYNKSYSSHASLKNHKGREWHYSDHNRKREVCHSDHVRGREAHHSRVKQHYLEHSNGVTPRSSTLPHPATGRSSNVSETYYRNYAHNVSAAQAEGQSSHSAQRHSSAPYLKRGTMLSEEKQNELLNALRDLVHKQLNSSGFKKSSAEEDYAWIEKLNQFNETPQFLPHTSSPPNDDK